MTQKDVELMERWMDKYPDKLFPMSLVYLYPNSWQSIIELALMKKGEKPTSQT